MYRERAAYCSERLKTKNLTDICQVSDASEQNRTVDIRIFSPPLYQLSYAGVSV